MRIANLGARIMDYCIVVSRFCRVTSWLFLLVGIGQYSEAFDLAQPQLERTTTNGIAVMYSLNVTATNVRAEISINGIPMTPIGFALENAVKGEDYEIQEWIIEGVNELRVSARGGSGTNSLRIIIDERDKGGWSVGKVLDEDIVSTMPQVSLRYSFLGKSTRFSLMPYISVIGPDEVSDLRLLYDETTSAISRTLVKDCREYANLSSLLLETQSIRSGTSFKEVANNCRKDIKRVVGDLRDPCIKVLPFEGTETCIGSKSVLFVPKMTKVTARFSMTQISYVLEYNSKTNYDSSKGLGLQYIRLGRMGRQWVLLP